VATQGISRFLGLTDPRYSRCNEEEPVRISLFGLIYLAIGLVVALTHGYNSVAGLSEILSLIIAVVLWPAVLLGVDLHLPAIAT
jgi:hypothetical protein